MYDVSFQGRKDLSFVKNIILEVHCMDFNSYRLTLIWSEVEHMDLVVHSLKFINEFPTQWV